MRYYDPRYDTTFKKVFGHPDLLISFLNALLPLGDDEQVESIEYLSPEMLPKTPDGKFSIVDVCCKDKKGRRTIQIGSEQAVYSMITSRFMPDYPTKDTREGFVDTGYKEDTVTVMGWIKDMPEYFKQLKREAQVTYHFYD